MNETPVTAAWDDGSRCRCMLTGYKCAMHSRTDDVLLPLEVIDAIREMQNDRKSGSVIIHFEQGVVRKVEQHRSVRVDERRSQVVG